MAGDRRGRVRARARERRLVMFFPPLFPHYYPTRNPPLFFFSGCSSRTRPTCSCAPRASAESQTFCSGSSPTPSSPSSTNCGRTSRVPTWIAYSPTTRRDSAASANSTARFSQSNIHKLKRTQRILQKLGFVFKPAAATCPQRSKSHRRHGADSRA